MEYTVRRVSNAMSLSGFFHSYPGLCVAQAFFHFALRRGIIK
jgi:hypothetical protein